MKKAKKMDLFFFTGAGLFCTSLREIVIYIANGVCKRLLFSVVKQLENKFSVQFFLCHRHRPLISSTVKFLLLISFVNVVIEKWICARAIRLKDLSVFCFISGFVTDTKVRQLYHSRGRLPQVPHITVFRRPFFLHYWSFG